MEPTRSIGTSVFRGYTAERRNAKPEFLSQPSLNSEIDSDGTAATRMGYEALSIDLNTASKAATSYYMKRYDVTFFASGTKLKYYDWTRQEVVDTGLTLTDGTTTRFGSFNHDLYLINPTDGLIRIMVTRLNGAVSLGGDVTIDTDGAARLSVFGDTTGNIRIRGTDEAFSSVTVATGVLDTTASQTYADNDVAIFVDNSYSSLEKGSKLFFWKQRMGIVGVRSSSNADMPANTVFFSKFTTGTTTSASSIEDITSFPLDGTRGSVCETVGEGGDITNILVTDDFLYLMKEKETHYAGIDDVIIIGSGIGSTTFNIRSPEHGCVNEDCAIDMGNGEFAMVTPNKRIMRGRIATDGGAATPFMDESFDEPIRDLLKLMDADQTGAISYYHGGRRQARFQVKIQSQWVTLVYDNNLRAWQPPHTGMYMKSYFERNGILYATDGMDDTVYRMHSTFNDNGSPIECYIASAIFDIGDAFVDQWQAKGRITQPAIAYFKNPVNASSAGAAIKTVTGSSYSYGTGLPLGGVMLGGQVLGGETDTGDTAEYDKTWDCFPSESNEAQFISYCLGDSHWFSVKEFLISYRLFPSPNRSQ